MAKTISTELQRIIDAKADIKQAIEGKGVEVSSELSLSDYAGKIEQITAGGGTPAPSISTSNFTGATIPLTYKDYQHIFTYNSAGVITISGLDGVATITGNGTNEVTVEFDTSSTTSALMPFTIEVGDYTFNGIWAHYGSDIGNNYLVFAYTNISPDGVGEIDSEYLFIEDSTAPTFASNTTIWNGIYSYQLLNVIISKSETNIGSYFLYYCYAFNQPIVLPDSLTTIGNRFLCGCYAFNQPIVLPDSLTSIGNNFLHGCYAFNQPIVLPNSLTTIGNDFLYYCHAFNQPIVLPDSLTSIGNSFLYNCYAFNQPIVLPDSLTSIGIYFLYNCYAFNQPIVLPNSLTSIGNGFLNYCTAFNQPIVLPDGLTSIGINFLQNCYSLSTIIWEASVYPTDNNSLSQNLNSKTSADGAGIKVYGSKRDNLIAALPNRTATPFRKLINGGR